MVINFAITVCDEHEYLDKLLFMISTIKHLQFVSSNVIIQADKNKVTEEVKEVCKKHFKFIDKYEEYPFNGDFSDFKNNLFKICPEGYIYQLDSDELPNHVQILYLIQALEKDPDIDLVYLPRVNIVDGITPDDVTKWKWRVDEVGDQLHINFPDYQGRVYKNENHLRWEGKVHERIVGSYKKYQLQSHPMLSILHIKDIDRQRNQNKMYDNL